MNDRPTVIGAGFISAIYLKNLTTRWNHVRVVGVADLVMERAEARAREFGIRVFGVDEILAHPEIEIVLNLTIPAAHAAVYFGVIRAGKSVYPEKPLTLDREEGQQLLHAAHQRGVLVGCAPDTFLGAGLQTVRRMIDEGAIGEPVAFSARMTTHGHESGHPEPAFYQSGAGPMLDMGPYYVTAIATLLGPVRRVGSMTRVTFPRRTITSEPKYGEIIEVNTPSHFETSLELESGVIGTLTTTFDLWDPEHCAFTIYGSEGSIRLPDPNTFGDPAQLPRGGEAWQDVPLDPGYETDTRGIGVADLTHALRTGDPPAPAATWASTPWMSCLSRLNRAISEGTSRSTAPSSSPNRWVQHPCFGIDSGRQTPWHARRSRFLRTFTTRMMRRPWPQVPDEPFADIGTFPSGPLTLPTSPHT